MNSSSRLFETTKPSIEAANSDRKQKNRVKFSSSCHVARGVDENPEPDERDHRRHPRRQRIEDEPRSRLVVPNLNQVKLKIARSTSWCSPPPMVAKNARNAKTHESAHRDDGQRCRQLARRPLQQRLNRRRHSGKSGISHCCCARC